MKCFLVATALLVSTAVHAQNYRETWDDVRKPWRANSEMDAELQADGLVCDRQVGKQHGRISSAYKKCMARHYWKLNHVERLPDEAAEPDDSAPPDPPPAPSPPILPDVTPLPPIILDIPPPS
jgi:hypothetical protein